MNKCRYGKTEQNKKKQLLMDSELSVNIMIVLTMGTILKLIRYREFTLNLKNI